eukprot:TRINITY_DN112649_c0_g1_i1.p1 TRINITY_DN112649_c0_g1~~TRINITY_DN112649_c0_g1_i1.p1  ORF type:complete len:588 (-),score=127.99 TRINITY_DN112649_c0_g1_i1:624-2387(-)
MGCTWGLRNQATARRQAADVYKALEGSVECTIPDPHLRGIALSQLRALLRFSKARCGDEQWLHRDPSRLGMRVQPQDINLYHLVDQVIKPATFTRCVSYVEFASSSPCKQRPQWFVSHYWGECVGDFITCLEHFRDRHLLSDPVPFWICAYALRQNPPGPEIGTGNPLDEPFAMALTMEEVKGTVMILDQPLAVFSRAWCTFEGTLTIQHGKRLDLVVSKRDNTHNATVAQMIADGPTDGDGSPAIQQYRDQAFPLEVAERGMNISIQDATATKVEDVNRILNCIARGTAATCAPPFRHENYELYNEAIREKFAAVVLRVAIATGSATSVRRALRAVPGVNLHWRNALGQTYVEAAEDLAAKNPSDQARNDIADYIWQALAEKEVPPGDEEQRPLLPGKGSLAEKEGKTSPAGSASRSRKTKGILLPERFRAKKSGEEDALVGAPGGVALDDVPVEVKDKRVMYRSNTEVSEDSPRSAKFSKERRKSTKGTKSDTDDSPLSKSTSVKGMRRAKSNPTRPGRPVTEVRFRSAAAAVGRQSSGVGGAEPPRESAYRRRRMEKAGMSPAAGQPPPPQEEPGAKSKAAAQG